MSIQFLSFLLIFVVCTGCASREAQPVAGPDYTHRLERQQLQGQPIPIPPVTPYDGNPQLQIVFINGFKKGWDIALEYWLGNAIAIPEAYQQSPEMKKAWQAGCNAGQQALYERVRSISAKIVSPR
jgi:hypothetical protein